MKSSAKAPGKGCQAWSGIVLKELPWQLLDGKLRTVQITPNFPLWGIRIAAILEAEATRESFKANTYSLRQRYQYPSTFQRDTLCPLSEYCNISPSIHNPLPALLLISAFICILHRIQLTHWRFYLPLPHTLLQEGHCTCSHIQH